MPGLKKIISISNNKYEMPSDSKVENGIVLYFLIQNITSIDS